MSIPYSKDTADQIKGDLYYIKTFAEKYSGCGLKKVGKSYRCTCFFHNEKSPSFTISYLDGKWLYKCFGCGRSGDVFKMIMEKEGSDFFETFRMLVDLRTPSGGGGSPSAGSNQTQLDF